MQNVLLVVPAGKEPQRAIGAAIELARQRGGTLVVLVVLDPTVPTQATSALTDVGFMGEQVGEEVGATIVREYRSQADTLLHALVERAKREGIAVTPLVAEGDTAEMCGRVIQSHQIGVAVLVAERRSWLTRFLSHSAAVKLPALSGCEVRVMEED
jgi:nucleotide-binding universal stress UspA family protein